MNNLATAQRDVEVEVEVDPEATDGITLAELLGGEAVGARLASMLADGPLGSMTLREFSLDREQAVAWMLRQRNCGRNTVHELVTLVDSKPRPTIRPRPPSPSPPLPEIELGELFAADALSARLFEVVRTTRLGTTTLPEFVRSQQAIESELLRMPNFGRRSVNELRGLVGMHARRQMEEMDLDPRTFGPEFEALLAAAPAAAERIDLPPAEVGIRELIEWHVRRLPERTADVIALRFGLKDAPAMTLQEIGDDYGITRERIRQIQVMGLKAMTTACRRFPVRPTVDAATQDLLRSVFGEGSHASSAVADRATASFDGWHELALLLSHGGIAAWLRKHARKLGGGWLAPGVEPSDVKAIATELRRRAKGRPFPRSSEEISDGLDPRLASAAMELVLGWRIEAGYAFARRPGPRLRRTALLHALLSREPLPMEMAPLLRRYHAAVPTDRCTDRDLVIVMEAATHLFLELHEGCWTAIGQAAPLETAEEPVDADAEAVPRSYLSDEGTVAAALERELARVGPTRLGELMNRAIDILPEGRSRLSVGPTLLTNPNRFVRVLPGVYALPHQVLDGKDLIHAGAIGYLLNAAQARFYAVGRKAGEGWGAFPLWTPTAEMRLCRWARAGDERSLYRSLLDVACIDEWPTDDADKEVWRELKARDGRYELWCDRRLSGAIPPLDRVLAAAIRLEKCGSIGWVAANRILSYVPSSYAGAGLLNGMVTAGLATQPPGEHGWQLPHGPGPRLAEWTGRLAASLHASGEIDWDSDAGAELAAVFTVSEGDPHAPVATQPFEELDDYESIMAEHRRAMQARRIEARLELDGE